MSDLRQHELSDDIVQIDIAEIPRVVNRRGEPIDEGFIDLSTQKRDCWRCIPCRVTFKQWPAVKAHIKEPV